LVCVAYSGSEEVSTLLNCWAGACTVVRAWDPEKAIMMSRCASGCRCIWGDGGRGVGREGIKKEDSNSPQYHL